MSTNFQTLDSARHGEKISFIGVIIEIGDLKSGTTDNGDYTYKRLLIQDATATLELTAWGTDIAKFVLGGKYEIVNAYAKEYKGALGLNIKYATVKLIGTNKDKNQSTMDETSKESPKEEPTVESNSKLLQISPALQDFVEAEAITLLLIEREVRTILHHYTPLPAGQEYNGGYVGLFVKEIYRLHKQSNFKKATDV